MKDSSPSSVNMIFFSYGFGKKTVLEVNTSTISKANDSYCTFSSFPIRFNRCLESRKWIIGVSENNSNIYIYILLLVFRSAQFKIFPWSKSKMVENKKFWRIICNVSVAVNKQNNVDSSKKINFHREKIYDFRFAYVFQFQCHISLTFLLPQVIYM